MPTPVGDAADLVAGVAEDLAHASGGGIGFGGDDQRRHARGAGGGEAGPGRGAEAAAGSRAEDVDTGGEEVELGPERRPVLLVVARRPTDRNRRRMRADLVVLHRVRGVVDGPEDRNALAAAALRRREGERILHHRGDRPGGVVRPKAAGNDVGAG